MTNKFFLPLLLLVFSIGMLVKDSFAGETDSLKVLLNKTTNPNRRVELLNELSKAYLNDNIDSSISISIRTKTLAENIKFKKGEALANKYIGTAYYLKGDYKQAILNWENALNIYKQIGDKKGIANILGNQASAFFTEGDDAKSLELDLKALKIAEEINDTLRIVTCLANVGTIYMNKKATFSKALASLERANFLSKIINDSYTIGTTSMNLGELYFKKKNYDISIKYLNESLNACRGTESEPYALNYLGKVYTSSNKLDKALSVHKNAIEISKKLDLKLDLIQSLIGLAQTYETQKEFKKAVDFYKEAVDSGLTLNALQEIKEAYEGLSNSYGKLKDFSSAFKYQNLLLSIKDSIYNNNTDKKLGLLQLNFDIEKKESKINLLTKDKEIQEQEITRQKIVRNSFIGGFAIVLLFAAVFFKQRNRIGKEKKRSDELLLNILPEEVAEELKEKGEAEAKLFDEVSVLFTDFKGFTAMSEKLTPKELVRDIHECFSAFDRIMEKYGIEKIKTIGDAYMAAGGIPVPSETHALNIVDAAFEIRQFIEDGKARKIAEGLPFFEIRIGIHTGPVVAGIVGVKKFAYDIWGDTVNTASRMESSGAPGKVNISSTTYELVKDKFQCEHRGKIAAKGKGEIDMYFVEKLEF
jgi:class 3 adenylate cyclase/lipopolysaccharide biosynthesis regulator YciM